jgi:hypothetical protein
MGKRYDGHALGIVLHVHVDDHFEDRLLLFRNAFVFSHAVYDKIGKIEIHSRSTMGYVEMMRDIECDICGAKRTWWADARALRILGSLYGKERV